MVALLPLKVMATVKGSGDKVQVQLLPKEPKIQHGGWWGCDHRR